MGRLPGQTGDDFIYHAINRGNNRADVLGPDGERDMFLGDLARTKARYPFALFGYCLMSNHFHLLLKPAPGQSISRILQSLTVAHTWRHHRRQGTSGHVWGGEKGDSHQIDSRDIHSRSGLPKPSGTDAIVD